MRRPMNCFVAIKFRPRLSRRLLQTAATLLITCVAPWGPNANAGGGPQNVAVIVNPNDPDSLEVGNEYVRLRRIPPCNVIYIPWQKTARSASAADFKAKLLEPIFRELERRGLTAQINVITYSCGYPSTVDLRGEIPATSVSPQSTPVASLNAATYLYHDLLTDPTTLLTLSANSYFTPAFEQTTDSQAFTSQFGWSLGQEDKTGFGRKFILSTLLGSTQGRGNRPEEICEYLRRAKAADGTAPKGTIYYMQNDDVRSKVRHETFPPAVAALKRLGVNAEIIRGSAPIKKDDVAGLTTGTSHLRLRTADCRLLPGALVDNLTSAAGVLFVSARIADPQTPVSEFMRMGAAGASGTVVEPYAIPAKFPSAALHIHYARGLSLAEAFYRTVSGPFQLLIIGDPLCQPWAKAPRVSVTGIDVASPVSGQLKITPAAAYEDARQASAFQLFVDGKLRSECVAGGRLALNTASLPDGWHEFLVVAIDDTPMAVQGAWSNELQVKNGRDSLQITIEAPKTSLAQAIDVSVMSTASGLPTTIMHNGRRLATLPGGVGTVSIKSERLGRGTVLLEAIQERDGRPVIRSRPVQLEVF